MYLYIHKPEGVSISKETLQMLIKKYKSGFMMYAYSDAEKWHMPERVNNVVNIDKMDAPFSAECESIIYLCDTFSGQNKKQWFFNENKDDGAWSIYFGHEIKSLDVCYNTSLKYKFNYSEDSAASMLDNIFLKAVSNLSKIRLLKFFLGYDKTESAIITNGKIHLITENQYDVNGAKFSNLEHENDLTSEEVKILALSLSLYKFLQGEVNNAKETTASLAKLPHRELKEMAHTAKLDDYCKSFGLTVSQIEV